MRDPLSRVHIKYKLTGAFVGICLFAFGAGGYIISVTAGPSLEREIGLRLQSEAQAIAEVLESRLLLMARRAEDFASDGFIRTRVEDILECQVDGRRRFALEGYHEDLARHVRRNKLPLVQNIANLAVYSLEGRRILAEPLTEATYAAGVVEEGVVEDTLWCSPFLEDENDGKYYFGLFTPVRDIREQRHLGSLVFWIDMGDWLSSLFTRTASNGIAIGKDHTVIISDQLGHRCQMVPVPLIGPSAGKGNEASILYLVRPLPSRKQQAATSLPQRRFLAHDHVIEGIGWTVHVSVDAQTAMLPVSGLQSRFLGVALLIAFVSLVLLFFPVRFLIKPLTAMSDAARAMTAGDFSQRVSATTEDEIGQLARSFNLMAEATQERTQKLENTARLLEKRTSELSVERDVLNSVVHSMREAVLYYDRNGEVILQNSAGEMLHTVLESGGDDVLPRRCDREHPGRQECKNCLLDPGMSARGCMVDVGSSVFEIVTTRIAADGAPEGTLLVARDVTTRMRIDERQAHQDRLAVLGEVSAVMAHELNNPLAAISMFTQLMRKDVADNARYSEHIDVILRNTDICKRTIRDLLSYSRDTESTYEECDLHELIPEIVRFLHPLYERSQVHFSLEFGLKDATLVCDEVYLRQVLVNLIMNALQAMDEVGGRVAIVTSECADDEQHIVVDICDSGQGIPEHLSEKVFEPFYTSKPSGEGTGLGLSISRRIIQSFGGSLELMNSQPGETVFRIQIPRLQYKGVTDT